MHTIFDRWEIFGEERIFAWPTSAKVIGRRAASDCEWPLQRPVEAVSDDTCENDKAILRNLIRTRMIPESEVGRDRRREERQLVVSLHVTDKFFLLPAGFGPPDPV